MATSSMEQVNAIAASETPLQALGPIANQHAANAAFADYLSRKASNTIRAQRFDLALFADYLAADVTVDAAQLQTQPAAWQGITWGIVEGFVRWQRQRYAGRYRWRRCPLRWQR